MKTELYHLKINERGALVVCTGDGEQIPGINGIEIEQDLNMMKAGYAQVKLSLIVRTKENLSKPKKDNESNG